MINPAAELSDLQRDLLDFERSWWKHPAAKETAIRNRFEVSPTRYYQFLHATIDKPAALAYDPLVVRRLQRLREARRLLRNRAARLAD